MSIRYNRYGQNFYVDIHYGSNITGDGTIDRPFRTIQYAIEVAPPIFYGWVTIHVYGGNELLSSSLDAGDTTEVRDSCISASGNHINLKLFTSVTLEYIVVNRHALLEISDGSSGHDLYLRHNASGTYHTAIIATNRSQCILSGLNNVAIIEFPEGIFSERDSSVRISGITGEGLVFNGCTTCYGRAQHRASIVLELYADKVKVTSNTLQYGFRAYAGSFISIYAFKGRIPTTVDAFYAETGAIISLNGMSNISVAGGNTYKAAGGGRIFLGHETIAS